MKHLIISLAFISSIIPIAVGFTFNLFYAFIASMSLVGMSAMIISGSDKQP